MVKTAVRYGAEIRKQAGSVSKAKRSKYLCPQCGKKSVKRKGYAIWKCNSCSTEFAGGAYSAATPVGETGRRIVSDYTKRKGV